jgi:5-methyltetrahydropteroyltriglutamate--homocysteine methyltransferase
MQSIYRSEHVGSLLRPNELLNARSARLENRVTQEKLQEIEDDAIRSAFEMQTTAGVSLFTDGEYRRGSYMEALALSIDGFVEGVSQPIRPRWRGPNPAAANSAPVNLRVVGERLRKTRRLTAHETGFLRRYSPGPFKITLPSPTQLWLQWYQPGVTDKVYSDRRELLYDIAMIVRDEIRAVIDEGPLCVQLDATSYIDYVDLEGRQRMKELGLDLDEALDHAIEADNLCFDGVDRGSVVTALHICRGNSRGNWRGEGGYDAIAEKLFNGLQMDRILLEFDTDRAGGFEPLRFVPKGKIIVLGLITTKNGDLESQDLLLRRIEEATQYIPIDQLALSPQCGFASSLLGNFLSWDDQRRKLELVVETAQKVWG